MFPAITILRSLFPEGFCLHGEAGRKSPAKGTSFVGDFHSDRCCLSVLCFLKLLRQITTTFSGLKWQRVILLHLWRPEVRNQSISRAMLPLKVWVTGWRGFSLASSSLWCPPEILGVPWLVTASFQSLPPSLQGLLVYMCHCVSPTFLVRTRVIRVRARPNPVWPHPN